jgi:hypothetical protein
MSCAFVIVPAVMASWPVLLPILTAAVSACGFVAAAQTDQGLRCTGRRRSGTRREEVEVPLNQSEVLGEALRRDTTFTAAKGGVTIEISKDVRGQLKVCASGEGIPKQQLQEEAQSLTNRIVQQYAYHKVMTDLKERGFRVVDEQVSDDQRIRLRVRRVQ